MIDRPPCLANIDPKIATASLLFKFPTILIIINYIVCQDKVTKLHGSDTFGKGRRILLELSCNFVEAFLSRHRQSTVASRPIPRKRIYRHSPEIQPLPVK